jgi:hypothetical protein
MSVRGFGQLSYLRAGWPVFVVASLLAGCAPASPETTVEHLSWACGERRCSVTFRLANESSDDEALAVRVRAYAGDSVQTRREVGEHTERLTLAPRGTKRYTVAVDTSERAGRVRVLLEFDER